MNNACVNQIHASMINQMIFFRQLVSIHDETLFKKQNKIIHLIKNSLFICIIGMDIRIH